MKERAVHGKTTEGADAQPRTVICAWCKQQERTGDTWGPLCSDLNAPDASHGICPACSAKQQAKLAEQRTTRPQ